MPGREQHGILILLSVAHHLHINLQQGISTGLSQDITGKHTAALI